MIFIIFCWFRVWFCKLGQPFSILLPVLIVFTDKCSFWIVHYLYTYMSKGHNKMVVDPTGRQTPSSYSISNKKHNRHSIHVYDLSLTHGGGKIIDIYYFFHIAKTTFKICALLIMSKFEIHHCLQWFLNCHLFSKSCDKFFQYKK